MTGYAAQASSAAGSGRSCGVACGQGPGGPGGGSGGGCPCNDPFGASGPSDGSASGDGNPPFGGGGLFGSGGQNFLPEAGMPVWSVSEPFISLWVHDNPLGYRPAIGRPISFHLSYNQRPTWSPPAGVFSVGPMWTTYWLNYIEYDADPQVGVTLNGLGGGTRTYTTDGVTREFYSGSAMQRLTNTTAVTGFTLIHPGGALDYYGYLASTTPPLAFLTQRVTAGNQTNSFVYTNNSGLIQLVQIIDGDGHTNYIRYTDANFPAQITEVEDPFGRKATLKYDALQGGLLTNITDVAGLASGFGYDTSGWMTRLTTPYGTTTFALTNRSFSGYDFGGTNEINRAVEITYPDGGKELYMYRDLSQCLGPSDSTPLIPDIITGDQVPTSTPVGTLDNTNMYWRNSFHWNRLQYSKLHTTNMFLFNTNDYNLAHLSHWLQYVQAYDHGSSYDGYVKGILSMERAPCPDASGGFWGQTTWYDYYGKDETYAIGTNSQPDAVVQVLPDGTQRYVLYQRNEWGHPTNVLQTWEGGTRTTTYAYAPNGIDLVQAIGPDGKTNASYAYDGNHHVLQATNAVNEVTYYTFNSLGQFTSVKTPAGLTTTNIYFSSGFYANWLDKTIDLEIQRTNSYTFANGLVSTHTDERGLTTTNTWDALGRLTSVAYPDGSTVSNICFLVGGQAYPGGSGGTNILDFTGAKDRLGNWTYYTYDSLRRLTAVTNALNYVTRYNYCTCGTLLDSVTDAQNHTTSFTYDLNGHRLLTTFPDSIGWTANHYDAVGRLTNVTDSAGSSVLNWYNNQGLLITVSNSFGLVKAITYDINDRPTSVTNANGVAVDSTYDDLGRVLTRTHPDSGVERFGYSPAGLVSYTNQLNQITRYAYDAAGRKGAETNANQEVTQFTYTPAGDLLTLTDGKNQTTTWHYDSYGRVTNKWDATTTLIFVYAYDANNRLTNRWTPAKSNTGYGYDALGNLTSIAYPISPAITLHYDALNRVTNMVDGVGTTTYGYDAAGQLPSEDGPWADDTVSYTYNNRLRASLSVLAPNADAWVESYGYDAAKRLTNVTSVAGGAFAYAYDPTRHLQAGLLTLPNGAHITNTYDSVARLLSTALIDSRGTNLDSYAYGYNQASQRTNVLRTAADLVNYTYDNIGQLQTAKGKESGGTTNRLNEQLGYTYDAAGNLNWRTNNALVEAFNVNSLNELTTATNAGTLTVAGTTTSQATNVTVNSYTAALYSDYTFAKDGFTVANGNNTFTAIAEDAYGRRDTNTINCYLPATNNFTYDSNGNLVSDGKRGFEYDDENQLVRVTVTNAWKSEFVYDGKMRRRIRHEYTWQSAIWNLQSEIHYVYDGNLVIQERDGNNLPLVTYTRGKDLSGSLEGAGGIGGLLARTDHLRFAIGDPSAHAYYHCDGNGNITCLINARQAIVARYLYDPYGGILSQSGPLADANLYRFSSKEFHVASGLVYYLYRFYEPSLQRWINRDPIGEDGGYKLYSFTGNTPLAGVDAYGLTIWEPPWPGDPGGPPGMPWPPTPIPRSPPRPPKAPPKRLHFRTYKCILLKDEKYCPRWTLINHKCTYLCQNAYDETDIRVEVTESISACSGKTVLFDPYYE
jgi:RHS repeat-associated protein